MTLPQNTLATRMLSLFLVLAVVACAWLLIAAPIAGQFLRVSEDYERLSVQLAKYRATVAQLQSVDQALQSHRTSLAQAGIVFEALSPDVAAANLQNLVSSLIASQHGQMQTAQRLQDVSGLGSNAVAVALSFAISNAGLAAVLDQINTLKPTLVVRALTIRTNEQLPSASPEPAIATEGPFEDEPVLTVDLEITAFVSMGPAK